MRFRLIKPKWAGKSIPGPSVLEGEYTQEFIEAKNNEGYNAYYFPNHNSKPIDGKFLSGKEVDTFDWIFVDMDLKDKVYESKEAFFEEIGTFPLAPSLIVDSGNGIHVYWRMQDLTRDKLIELQFRLITRFKTDSSVWTPLQLMRVPGSLNTKNQENFINVLTLLDDKEASYTVAQLDAELPPITETQKNKMIDHINKLSGVTTAINLESYDTDELPEAFEKILESDAELRKLWYAERGERSDADWKLAHKLFDLNYHKLEEALPVMLNTQKALDKGNYRKEYAYNTIDKVWRERENFAVPSVAERIPTMGMNGSGGTKVNGPAYLDASFSGWKKGEVLGMIAGPGVGKTTTTLDIFYEMMVNNPENDDVYIFFSLEMPDYAIINRWKSLIGDREDLNKRLYVVSNEDINGVERHINLQKLYWFAEGIKKVTGKDIGAVAIDHLGILELDIDINKKPNFGILGEDVGFGSTRNISFTTLCSKVKELAKKLNCFIIAQSQTTKEKGKGGDTELGVDAAYGTAKFEWYTDYIITFWQPLRRVEAETDLRALGWQYGKIREKHPNDRVKVYEKKVLAVDLMTGKLRPLTEAEMIEFDQLEQKASNIRAAAEKNKSVKYSNSDTGFKKLKNILQSITGGKRAVGDE